MIVRVFVLLVGLMLLLSVMACDEGDAAADGDADTDSDGDSDSDTDSDADADFPGDCASAVRFTFDGQEYNFCSSTSDISKCTVDATGEWMTCVWYQDMENALTLSNLKLDLISQGVTYFRADNISSSLSMLIGGKGYNGLNFELYFEVFEGSGGEMAGSFSDDTIRESSNQELAGEITDGQFYAPIVQE